MGLSMFSIILIVGAVVGGLVLLVMLYVMCRSCKSQAQREQDIEDNRHRLRSYNDQVSQVQKLPQRRPHMHLITEGARPANRRPGQRGHEDSLLSEARNSGKRPLLHKAAIMKHIHPSCNSDREAVHFSTERDKKYGTEVNHVFRINPNEFIEARENREMVFKEKCILVASYKRSSIKVYRSIVPCQYWECKKKSGKFEVHVLWM